jgi:threonine dehydrogenase-like Zn-dependent dehydrogenase
MGVQGVAVGDLVFSGDFCQHTEYFAAPAAADNLWLKLPAAVKPQHAALFGVASVALHDVRRAGVRLGERALVIGAGPIGQLTAQAARLAGAVVTVCDIDAQRLEIAGSLGAHGIVPLTTEAASWDAVKKAGPFDVVIEDSGAPVLDSAIGANWGGGVLKHRSRVLMVAGRDRVSYSFNAGQGYEMAVLHAGHFVRDDLVEVCRLAAEGALRLGPIVRDIVKAADAPAVYERLRDEPGSLFGVVFDWQ